MSKELSDLLPPSLGTLLGRYKLVRLIGEGGMGWVFEATHVDLDKTLAIKVLRTDAVRNPQLRVRFLREGLAAARISHPNVAQVFDLGQEGDWLYLVMEYLTGEDLAHRLARQGVLSIEEALAVILPIAGALTAAHEAGIVHRDLKPENIFLASARFGVELPKLLDFGISQFRSRWAPRVTVTRMVLGTPAYMAPEQTRSLRATGPLSDQYSLAVVLYECVCGRLPFDAEEPLMLVAEVAEGQYPTPRELMPTLDPEFEAVLLRAMAIDPARRFASVVDFARALLPYASSRDQLTYAPTLGVLPPQVETEMAPATRGGAALFTPAEMPVVAPPMEPTPRTVSRRYGWLSVVALTFLGLAAFSWLHHTRRADGKVWATGRGAQIDAAPNQELRPAAFHPVAVPAAVLRDEALREAAPSGAGHTATVASRGGVAAPQGLGAGGLAHPVPTPAAPAQPVALPVAAGPVEARPATLRTVGANQAPVIE